MLQKIARFSFILLLFVTPLIMYSGTSEIFEFNKIMFIYLITVFIAFYLYKILLIDHIQFKRTPLDLFIVIFFISQLLSTLFSIDVHTSFFGYYGRFNGGLISTISYIVLAYGLIHIADIKFVYKLLKTSLLSSVFVMLWGMSGKLNYDLTCFIFTGQLNNSCWTNQFHPETRMFSTLGQPNWLGAFLSINFMIGVLFLLKNISHKKTYWLYWFYLILNFSCILFTRSRSAIIATLIGVAVIVLLGLLTKLKKNIRVIPVLPYRIVFSILILITLFKTDIGIIDNIITLKFITKPQVLNSLREKSSTLPQSVTDTDIYANDVTESFDLRKIVWKGAAALGKKYPVFGTGVETFGYGYYFVRPSEHNITSEWDFLYNKAHNEFLNYFGTTGYVGVASYIILILSFFVWIIYKILTSNPDDDRDKERNLVSVGLLLAYLSINITNFVGFSTTTISLFFYLIPALLVIVWKNHEEKIEKLILSKITLTDRLFLYLGIIITVFTSFYVGIYLMADIAYAKGDGYYRAGDYQNAITNFNQALTLRYDHVYEDKLSYSLANLALLSSLEKQNSAAMQLILFSDRANTHSLSYSPKNILYWKTRAKNYYLFYQATLNPEYLRTGLEALFIAKGLAPTDPKIPYSIAVYEMLMADEEKDTIKQNQRLELALSEINLTIKLKPNLKDFYILKAQILLKSGLKNEARLVYEGILQNFDKQDEEVLELLEKL